jgi:hypothetical protein
MNTVVLALAALVVGFAVGRVKSLAGFRKSKSSAY